MEYRFTKLQRLRRNAEFKQVLSQQTNRCKGNCVTVLYLPNKAGYARLGVCIGKRNIRRAVDRNRLKRQIRESFRFRQSKLDSLDCVVLVHRGFEYKNKAEIAVRLEKLWDKLIRRCSEVSSA